MSAIERTIGVNILIAIVYFVILMIVIPVHEAYDGLAKAVLFVVGLMAHLAVLLVICIGHYGRNNKQKGLTYLYA